MNIRNQLDPQATRSTFTITHEPMNTKTWTTKDGTKTRIKDMDDGHLLNTIKFIERMAEGEAEARMMFESDDTPFGFSEPQYPDIFNDLIAEAHKRKLPIE